MCPCLRDHQFIVIERFIYDFNHHLNEICLTKCLNLKVCEKFIFGFNWRLGAAPMVVMEIKMIYDDDETHWKNVNQLHQFQWQKSFKRKHFTTFMMRLTFQMHHLRRFTIIIPRRVVNSSWSRVVSDSAMEWLVNDEEIMRHWKCIKFAETLTFKTPQINFLHFSSPGQNKKIINNDAHDWTQELSYLTFILFGNWVDISLINIRSFIH